MQASQNVHVWPHGPNAGSELLHLVCTYQVGFREDDAVCQRNLLHGFWLAKQLMAAIKGVDQRHHTIQPKVCCQQRVAA